MGDGVLQGSTDDETPAETPLGSRLLLDGSEGSDVRALQEMLLSLGYALPRYGADGNSRGNRGGGPCLSG